eukprot:1154466-Pelagomonas_calceolata.AAC.6
MKRQIIKFLFDSLGAKLSDEESLITDACKCAAHLIDFEIGFPKDINFIKTNEDMKKVPFH